MLLTPVSVPRRLADAVVRRPLIEVATDRALVRYPGVGRVLVPAVGSPQWCADPGRAPEDLEFLGDVVDALRALLVGRFPMRASSVVVGGRAVVVGSGGVLGRSTLAAALWTRGHSFLADSVTVVDAGSGAPVVEARPGGPDLWPDAVEQLGLDPSEGTAVRRGLALRRFAMETSPGAVDLGAIVLLRRAPEEPGVQSLAGFDAVAPLIRAGWHRFAIAPIGAQARQFAWAVDVVARVPVLTVSVRRDLGALDATADAVLASLAEHGIGS